MHYNLTRPGPGGWLVALAAEFAITGLLLGLLFYARHSARLKKLAGWLAAGLIWVYIILETPLSGMSLNPGRTLGTAVPAGQYPALWVYFGGPVAAGWLVAVLFRRFYKGEPLTAAVVAGSGAAPEKGPLAARPPHYPAPHAANK